MGDTGRGRQRLKLAIQMAEKADVYVLDEPTIGLHLVAARSTLTAEHLAAYVGT